MRKYICEGLANYLAKSYKPWHMPGHKRKNYIDEFLQEFDTPEIVAMDGTEEWLFNMETILTMVATIDVTEIPDTDDLHHPEEMIASSMEQMKKLYGTYASYYMVNGSTGGILSAIGAVASSPKERKSNQIIIARNCHKSVYNACELFGLKPIYLEPEHITLNDKGSYIYGDIKIEQIKELVTDNPEAVAVVITSPTYEGILSDVAGIKKELEPYGIPLIVDEAHGAHLPFIEELPQTAVSLDADIVVHSLHKTMPAMTQTALLHVNNDTLDKEVRKYLSVFMTTSPSYPMLCSMEYGVVSSWERKVNQEGFGKYLDNLKSFRNHISNLKNIKLLGQVTDKDSFFEYDDTRIVLYSQHTGKALAEKLKEIGHIEVEMSGANYVVLISTYVDKVKDFEHLEKTIKQVDEILDKEAVDESYEDTFSKEEMYKLVGTLASNNIYVYPPGNYIVASGEVISKEAMDNIIQLRESGKKIVGLEQDNNAQS